MVLRVAVVAYVCAIAAAHERALPSNAITLPALPYNRVPYLAAHLQPQLHASALNPRSQAPSACVAPALSDPNYLSFDDSSGHRTVDIGNYDQCLNTAGAKHCVLYFYNIPMGVCVPSNCTEADIGDVTSDIFVNYIGNISPLAWVLVLMGLPVTPFCGDHSVALTPSAIAVITVMAAWGAVMVVASTVRHEWVADCTRQLRRKRPEDADEKTSSPLYMQLLDCFAVQRSVPALLRTSSSTARNGVSTAPLNGVRVLSMSLVVLGHTLFFMQTPGIYNQSVINPPTGLAEWSFQIFPSAEFAVDTFFTMSGFLCAYLLLKELSKLFGWRYTQLQSARGAYELHDAAVNGGIVDARPLLASSITSDGRGASSAHALSLQRDDEDPADHRALSASACAPRAASKLAGTMTYYVVHRLWRLMPLLGILIAFYTNVMPSLSFGPFWMFVSTGTQHCADWWWTTLLFINDYVPSNDNFDNQCIAWTWYLGLDMQLYLLTPIAVAIFLWNARAGWTLLTVTTLALLVACEEIVRQNNLTVLLTTSSAPGEANGDYQGLFYTKLWTRAPPYLIGVALAFLLFTRDAAVEDANRERARRRELSGAETVRDGDGDTDNDTDGAQQRTAAGMNWPVVFNYALLCVSLVVLAAVFYVPTDYYHNGGGQWSQQGVIIYTAFSRSVWGLALCGMLYACFVMPDLTLSRFLSLPVFEPLARITYGAYLCHPIVMIVSYYSSVTLYRFDSFTITSNYIANVALAYGVAAMLFVCVEYPLGALEKTLLAYVAARRQSGNADAGVAREHEHKSLRV